MQNETIVPNAVHNADAALAPMVAPGVDPGTKKATAPTYPFNFDVTECEVKIIETMREWRRAETDKALYYELTEWDYMRYLASDFKERQFTVEKAISNMGGNVAQGAALFDAVKTIVEIFPVFSDQAEEAEAAGQPYTRSDVGKMLFVVLPDGEDSAPIALWDEQTKKLIGSVHESKQDEQKAALRAGLLAQLEGNSTN